MESTEEARAPIECFGNLASREYLEKRETEVGDCPVGLKKSRCDVKKGIWRGRGSRRAIRRLFEAGSSTFPWFSGW